MGLELKNEKSKSNLSEEQLEAAHMSEQWKKRKFLKMSSTKKTLKNNYKCFSSGKINIKNEWNEFQLGGDEEESNRERSKCRQTELNQPLKEIDGCDVIKSCDLTLNSVGREKKTDECSDRKNCPGHRLGSNKSTCSEGSYSRRKHHKHHKHKQKKNNFVEMEEVINAKVNPIFLWVRQENTRIVEVLCEDYDHRNRLRLTRTHLGWRAIPKTKRFAEVIIPKSLPKIKSKDSTIEPKNLRKIGRRKKNKRRKNNTPKISLDNPNEIKKCSVALLKNDLVNNKSKSSIIQPDKIENQDNQKDKGEKEKEIFILKPENISEKEEADNNDCEEKMEIGECDKYNILNIKESSSEHKNEPEENKEMSREIILKNTTNSLEVNKKINHSELSLMDLTKEDSDLNETDYDELGQLLNDMPDLEFVEKDVLEEVDQNKWSASTDPTLSKNSVNTKTCSSNLLLLPSNISPLITVTAAVNGSSEPLTAPHPEVTITPILTSKKLGDQDKKHVTFLENFIPTIQALESENKESILENKHFNKTEKKIYKHCKGNNIGPEILSKKHKQEVTTKNVFSKHRVQFSKKKPVEESYASCISDLLPEKSPSDPISQLKEVLCNPLLQVPDPLLVPKARLPALVESPATEIPRLLKMHFEKLVEEKQYSYLRDSDVLEVSLSNLQSLLSANTKELSNYQKSLQTFLDWQKYQTELLEVQMINSNTLSSEFTKDLTGKHSAFPPMFWLPYLHHFDFKSNHDFVSAMNSMLNCKFEVSTSKLTVPPQINVNQVSQPSPFLTPTSPMDVESHLKTLTMWQEAVMMQQNLQGMQSFCKDFNATTQDVPKAGKFTHSFKKQYSGTNFSNYCTKSCREEKCQSEWNSVVEELQKNQRYRPIFHGGIEKYHKSSELNQKCKYETRNRLQNYQNNIRYQDELFCPNKLNENSLPESVILNSLPDHFETNSNFCQGNNICATLEEEFKDNSEITSEVAARLQQFNTQIQRIKVKKEKHSSQNPKMDSGKREVPKLKVKNLVDPNMSPPKLLKQIPTEQLPVEREGERAEPVVGQNHLWHPLFGSNQIKNQVYNSPWNWTTVTVNGE